MGRILWKHKTKTMVCLNINREGFKAKRIFEMALGGMSRNSSNRQRKKQINEKLPQLDVPEIVLSP